MFFKVNFLKANIFKAISFKNPVRLPLTYWLLVILRFALTLLPQTGYIHPDEFFQNIEVIAADIFTIDVSKTWEFDPNFPVRNIFVPKLVIGPSLHFIRLVSPFTKHYLNVDLKTPYYFLVIPRLLICMLSLINDYCLYRICSLYGQNYRTRLSLFASSYVVLVYCCRSFSNSFEMILFSILLMLVAECMLKSDKIIYHTEFLKEKYDKSHTPVDKVLLYKLQSHLPEHSLNRVFVISNLVVLGIFNRPTFVGFALLPTFFWLYRGLGSQVIGFRHFNVRILTFILCGIPSVVLLILVDSSYYGYITTADVESLKISWDNWVVTPLNFLRYNLDKRNLGHHGLHPRWLHLAVNLPLLFNVLAVLGMYKLIVLLIRLIKGDFRKLPRVQSITGLMLLSLVVPVALLSMFPHQEPRFIIPVLVPLVYLYGNLLQVNEVDNRLERRLKQVRIAIWYIINIIATVFFGFIHQGGIYPLTKNLHYEIKNSYGTHIHLVTTHSYSIPTFLLQLESTTKVWKDRKTGHKYRLTPTTFIKKYGSIPLHELMEVLDVTLTNAERLFHESKKNYRFYLATPCSKAREIQYEANTNQYFNLVDEFSYYPHYCTEALPTFPSKHDQTCLPIVPTIKNESQAIDLSFYDRISCYVNRFCLKVFRVHVKNYDKV